MKNSNYNELDESYTVKFERAMSELDDIETVGIKSDLEGNLIFHVKMEHTQAGESCRSPQR